MKFTRFEQVLSPSQLELEEAGLQFDEIIRYRPGENWKIHAVQSVPTEQEAASQYMRDPSPFVNIHLTKTRMISDL